MRFSLAEKGTKMADLKRCPFCGSRAVEPFYFDPCDGYQGDLGSYIVCCSVCSAEVSSRDKNMAIEAWNRRYTPSEIDFDYEAED